MLSMLLLACLLQTTEAVPKPDVMHAYREQVATLERTPEAHLALAEWCEGRGLRAERDEHLARALVMDPSNRQVRAMIGLHAVSPAEKAEYVARRERTPKTADARWDLALWCEKLGLKDEAQNHLTEVVLLDPSRDAAWKRLGYKKHEGQWLTEAQIDHAKRESDAQQRADKSWRTLLEKWRARLKARPGREDTLASLSRVHDPRAVPSIIRVFGLGSEVDQAIAVQLLGQIESSASTRALAVISVQSKSANVRRAASETLRPRDPGDYLDLLTSLLSDEIRYEIRPANNGGTGSVLVVEGPSQNLIRRYLSTSPLGNRTLLVNVSRPGPPLGFVLSGTTVDQHLPPNAIPVGYRHDGTALFILDDTGVTIQAHRPGSSYSVNPIPAYFGGAAPQSGISQIPTSRVEPPSPVEASNAPSQNASNPAVLAGLPPDLAAAAASLVPSTQQFQAQQLAMIQQQINLEWLQQESLRMARAAILQQAYDVAVLDRMNAQIQVSNDRILMTLGTATGQSLGPKRDAWLSWWAGQRGSQYVAQARRAKPTYYEDAPIPYRPVEGPAQVYKADPPKPNFCIIFEHHLTRSKTPSLVMGPGRLESDTVGEVWISTPNSCFVADTAVATPDGPRPIALLVAGDPVYVRDLQGRTGIAPVLSTHHGGIRTTILLETELGPIETTGSHPFLHADGRWVRADDLKPGDQIATRAGRSTVKQTGPGRIGSVFNLEVSGGNTFFVGKDEALVHDGTRVSPQE